MANASDSERKRIIGFKKNLRQADKSRGGGGGRGGGRTSQPERPSSPTCVKVMTMGGKSDAGLLVKSK